uniref:Transcription factor bHLH47 isoform X2 n=1 Tax=Rhizophora mucronata TaxID=61149 RepID=A0A2P2KQ29_RHIMU
MHASKTRTNNCLAHISKLWKRLGAGPPLNRITVTKNIAKIKKQVIQLLSLQFLPLSLVYSFRNFPLALPRTSVFRCLHCFIPVIHRRSRNL